MAHVFRALRFVLIVLLVPPLLGWGLLAGANTDVGRGVLADAIGVTSGGRVRVVGLSGRLAEGMAAARVELRDGAGVWLTVEGVSFDWFPMDLLSGTLRLGSVHAALVREVRAPVSEGAGGGVPALPARVVLGQLGIDRLELPGVVPLAVEGSGEVRPGWVGRLGLAARRIGGGGTYSIAARRDASNVSVRVAVEEPGGGVIGGLAGLGGDPVSVVVTLEGPPSAVVLGGSVAAGPLRAALSGRLDAVGQGARVAVEVADVAPFAALGGVELAGAGDVSLKVRPQGGDWAVSLGVTWRPAGLDAPLGALLGPVVTAAADGVLRGETLDLSRLAVDGALVHVTAAGALSAPAVGMTYDLRLDDLRPLAAGVDGTVRVTGRVAGPPNDPALSGDVAAEVGVEKIPRQAVTGIFAVHGLAAAPVVEITGSAPLGDAPMTVAATVRRGTDGTVRLDVGRVGWKSAQVGGAFTIAPGASLPLGTATLQVGDLREIGDLLGVKGVSGTATAEVALEEGLVRLGVALRDAGAPQGGVARADLAATLRDPLGAREIDGTLVLEGLRADGVAGALRLSAAGPPAAVAVKLTSTVAVAGAPVQASVSGTLDVLANTFDLAGLQAGWRGEQVSAGPARVRFGDGVAVDRLRLRLRQAELDVSGKVFPVLDLTAALRGLNLDLVKVLAPGVALSGTVQGDARLTGAPAAPGGTIRLTASGVRLNAGAAAALRPVEASVAATLTGSAARIDAAVTAGADRLSAAGTVPLGAGRFDLRVGGRVGLEALDAVLAAGGRRVRGRITLDATLAGTAAKPLAAGTLRLAGGEWQDAALGMRVHDIAAVVTAAGDTLTLASLTGTSGAGTISATGSVGLAAAMPVQARVTARHAGLLASDLITTTVDGELSLSGALSEGLSAAGTITLGRTEIRVPERLPSGVAVLNVRRPGQALPPPPPPATPIALDITVRAPGEMFIRGRGLDAEVRGRLHLGGTSAEPRPDGGFSLRRGAFSLAGRALTFTAGRVGLDGSLPIDPTLDFTATTTGTGPAGTTTATLRITGHASRPEIALSSVPVLPQDEILAELLFNRASGSLSPLEGAQIAVALAQLTGVGSGFQPLDALRAGLGLDRLSVGGGANGTGTQVEAGRRIAPRVYLGVRQGTDGTGSQATMQVDLYKGLKLQADLGTQNKPNSATGAASTGSGIGLTYQFEY